MDRATAAAAKRPTMLHGQHAPVADLRVNGN
jgi:hypothetical protein